LLHDLPVALEVIGNATGCSVGGATLSINLKAHRLGKRAVLCADLVTASGETKRCYVRLRPTASPEGASAFARHRIIASQLSAATGIRTPAALHFDAEWGAAIYSDVQGASPDFAETHNSGAATRVGGALAALRVHGPMAGNDWRAKDEIAGLMQWSELIGTYLPERQGAFDAALQWVAEHLTRLRDVDARPCHRDFHEGQILLTEGSCGVIDFDTWCRADPALDIGNFAAHIRLWELRTGGNAVVFAGEFLQAAIGSDSQLPSRAAVWQRAALLRLAAMLAFTSERTEVVDRLLLESSA
jgi:aminoglycoside phosphotransferase (APT) family kinase protein